MTTKAERTIRADEIMQRFHRCLRKSYIANIGERTMMQEIMDDRMFSQFNRKTRAAFMDNLRDAHAEHGENLAVEIARHLCWPACYVFRCEGGAFFKVGHSIRVDERRLAVQCGCPLPINRVMFALFVSRRTRNATERAIHHELRDYQASGEWFDLGATEAREALEHVVLKRMDTPQTAGIMTYAVPPDPEFHENAYKAIIRAASDAVKLF